MSRGPWYATFGIGQKSQCSTEKANNLPVDPAGSGRPLTPADSRPIVQDMRALSIRQPYAELILRGIKTIEYRSQRTRTIGERFYIYASMKWAGVNAPGNGHDVGTP